MAVTTAVVLALAGCQARPDLPPVFRLDELDYWWDDDGGALVVRVAFTNIADFTPGEQTLPPEVAINLYEYRAVDGGPGEETVLASFLGNGSVRIVFAPYTASPWQDRWDVSKTTGPMLIRPGETVALEVELEAKHAFRGDAGHYYVKVSLPSFYPPGVKETGRSTHVLYSTGCFNPTVPEFYGIAAGPDCIIWDCNGGWTYSERKMTDIHARADCPLTEHRGP